MPAKSNLRLVKPSTEKRAVARRQQPDRELLKGLVSATRIF